MLIKNRMKISSKLFDCTSGFFSSNVKFIYLFNDLCKSNPFKEYNYLELLQRLNKNNKNSEIMAKFTPRLPISIV